MKRILTRMAALSLLVIATFWFATDDTKAGRWGCAEQMFAAQSACDDSLSGTIGSYNNVTNFSPNQCNSQASNQCHYSQDPNCYTNAYNSCYNTTVTNWNDRYSTYGDCVSGTMNYSCYEEPDFCAAARDRNNQCIAMYPPDPENPTTAYMDCRSASGIDMCQ